MSNDAPVESVDELVAACVEARRTGKKADCDSLIHQHPEFASEVAVFLDDYDRVEEKLAPLRELFGSSSCSPGEIPTLGSDETAIPPVPKAGSSFGDYELLAEISRGGMGVVFKARQRSLNRIVALKMVLGGKATTDRERFLVEARAVARLSHPHIVPIYEVGEESGRPFFTMEFFSGGSLRERIDELRGDQRAVSRLMATVARAVEHAHRRGILHRDLKPSNVLLDDRREPHVTDFGLAKRLDEESSLTQAGAIVGTPSYMAPEQAHAATDLSTAVDVYGLGAVLYELLTGRPPFKGSSPIETMNQARTQAPLPPRELAAGVDPDLETICLKCLEKDPQARYGSADDMADDLHRWLDGKPVHARKVTARERLVKWAHRQPLMAGAAATIGVACLGLLILGGFLWQNAELRATAVQDLNEAHLKLAKIESGLHTAEEKRTLAEEQRKTAESAAEKVRKNVNEAEKRLVDVQHDASHTRYAADMLLLHAAWQNENLSAVSDLLDRYHKSTGREDLRGFEWHYLNRQFHGARLSWRDAPEEKASQGSNLGMAISPDGKLLATAQMENKLKLWNLADGRLLREIEMKKTEFIGKSSPDIAGLFFADDGRTLVAVVRTTPTAREPQWSVPPAASAALIATPSLLAAASPTGFALAKSALDAANSSAAARAGNAAASVSKTASDILNGAAGDSDQLKIESLADSLEYHSYSLTDQDTARVESFDPSRLQTPVLPFLPGPISVAHKGKALIIWAMDRSPNGKYLALAGAETKAESGQAASGSIGSISSGKLIIWDLAKGRVCAEQNCEAMLTAVTFSPDSAKLAVGAADGAVGIVGPDLAEPLRPSPGHHGWVCSLKFTRDGRGLVGGVMDGLVLLWDVLVVTRVNQIHGNTLTLGGPTNLLVASEADRLRGHTSAVCCIELSPDGQSLVSGSIDGNVKVWDLPKADPLIRHGQAHAGEPLILRGHETTVSGLAFGVGGDQLTSVDIGGTMRYWRLQLPDGRLQREIKSKHIDDLIARVSSSGKTIAWKEADGGAMLVRDVATGRETRLAWNDHVPAGLTLSPDDRLLAAADLSTAGGLAVWDIASGRQLATGDCATASAIVLPLALAFSPDNKFLAVAQGGGVLLWDWRAAKSRTILEGKDAITTAVAFSADGKLVAAASRDATQVGIATVRIWDLQADLLLAECHGAGQNIASLTFSPDGHRLATGGTSSQQGILKLWDTDGGREVFSEQFPMATITAVAFSADGRRLAAAVTPIDLTKFLIGHKFPSEVYIWDGAPVAAEALTNR